ncbi:4-hydroxy-tetrahydrodipicolinate reductase [Bacillus sp. HMF5848]|nr:4-hydroxy-tetrahydrodipicolinate reductase [Bacillus sp. HMF5848]
MGSEAVKLVNNTNNYQLVAVVDRSYEGDHSTNSVDVPVYTDLDSCLQSIKADVLIDLTTPEVGVRHTKTALQYGVRPVVGTTGFTDKDLQEIEQLCHDKNIGAIIAPNFAIGAILMMKFSQMAAKYLPNVEIIEMHHDQKLDAPSGTAIKTAQMISTVREAKGQGHEQEKETLAGARGADFEGMKIHSVRLPGLIAHQQVLFGGQGQALTIRHDSFTRESFMTGVKLSVDTVVGIDTLVYGLENIIE